MTLDLDRAALARCNGGFLALLAMERMQATVRRHGFPAADTVALLTALRKVVRVADGPVLDRVRATRLLRVATTGDYAPFSFEAHGHLSGADIELARDPALQVVVDDWLARAIVAGSPGVSLSKPCGRT